MYGLKCRLDYISRQLALDAADSFTCDDKIGSGTDGFTSGFEVIDT
jgi:hypothetical protein